MTDYRPIACALHDRYEIAVMHRTRLTLCWRGPDGLIHLENLLPQDLETLNGEEFLVASNRTGERLRLRLDRIMAVHSNEFAENT